MATARNLALEEQGISKKLFWGQFCALVHNDTARDWKMLCECRTAEETIDVLVQQYTAWQQTLCLHPKWNFIAFIHKNKMEAIFVPPGWIDYHNKWWKDSSQTLSFGSFSDDSEKASQTDVKTDTSSCTLADNKKQPTCLATAESPPTEQEFIILLALLKSLKPHSWEWKASRLSKLMISRLTFLKGRLKSVWWESGLLYK